MSPRSLIGVFILFDSVYLTRSSSLCGSSLPVRLRMPDMNRWTPTVEFNYRDTHDLEGGWRAAGGGRWCDVRGTELCPLIPDYRCWEGQTASPADTPEHTCPAEERVVSWEVKERQVTPSPSTRTPGFSLHVKRGIFFGIRFLNFFFFLATFLFFTFYLTLFYLFCSFICFYLFLKRHF